MEPDGLPMISGQNEGEGFREVSDLGEYTSVHGQGGPELLQ